MELLGLTFSNCLRRVTLKQLNVVIASAFFILFRLTFDFLTAVCAASALLFAVLAVYYYLNWNRKYMFTSKIAFLTIVAVMLACAWGEYFLLTRTLWDVFKIAFEHKYDAYSWKIIDYVQGKYHCCGWKGPENYLDGEIPYSCINHNRIYSVGCKSKFYL
uniref:Tetraspanin n=1 Tax=Glossina austeni TaxID=7395 RepID=A0A1A9VGK2_GLOAU